ncbi:hypothetical protein ACFVYP_39870 [Kitasatospora sp. NPDC058201]|uniref:hypothetical protein n=1 Tax=unclassified Kitasatospora TaxID=2633591 RepID=UPI00364BD92A
MTVHARQMPRGWTLALTTGPGHLHASLTRPNPRESGPVDGSRPALELTVNARLTDPYPVPNPTSHSPRQRALRLWRRWAHRHPAAALQPAVRPWDGPSLTRTVGPWTATATLNQFGLHVQRLPEFDCLRHALFTDDCYPDSEYRCACGPGLRYLAAECTCPRIRPRLHVSLTRPELYPEEPSF